MASGFLERRDEPGFPKEKHSQRKSNLTSRFQLWCLGPPGERNRGNRPSSQADTAVETVTTPYSSMHCWLHPAQASPLLHSLFQRCEKHSHLKNKDVKFSRESSSYKIRPTWLKCLTCSHPLNRLRGRLRSHTQGAHKQHPPPPIMIKSCL